MDLIDRQAAIKEIQNVRYRLADVTMRMINAVKKVPSAQPEQRWISCEEQLPEDQNTVLITDDGGLWYDLGFYSDGDGWSYTSGDYVNYHVSAWMQIPPYRRE